MRVIKENKNKIAVLGWGRFNPPTIGHQLLGQFVRNTASKVGGTPMIYSSHTYKKKKDKNGLWGDPLPYEEKAKWLKKVFGNIFVESDLKVLTDILKDIYNKGYRELYLVAGSDRIDEYGTLINKYNNVPTKSGNILYNFDNIEIVPVGEERDDNAEGVASVSGTGTRKLAYDGDLEGFKKAVPFSDSDAEELYNVLRSELELNEALLTEEPVGVPAMSKNTYIKLKDEVDKELKKYGLVAPDENKGIDDYKADQEDYQGLFVKQNSDKKLSFSEKDLFNIAQNNSNIPDDIVDILDNLVIVDQKGNKYGLHKSGLQASSNKKDSFTGTTATYYQEAIYSLLLVDKIPEAHGGSFRQWLLESDPQSGTGVFKYIIPKEVNQAFNNKWQGFVDDWFLSFKTIVNNNNEFIMRANEILEWDVTNAVILHNGVNNEFADIAEKLLTGRDSYDKSDVYYCVGDVYKITAQMLSQPSIKDYVQFMLDNCKQIIGVSLKKPSGGKLIARWDIPAVNDNYFNNKVIWTGSESGLTQVIRFSTDDGEIQFQIKSNKAGAAGTLEWKAKNAKAQLGKAVIAAKTVLGNEAKNTIITPLSSKVRNFNLAAENFMRLITGENEPRMYTEYSMTEKGLRLVTQIFNLSCGFAAVDINDMKRITAPYLKVE